MNLEPDQADAEYQQQRAKRVQRAYARRQPKRAAEVMSNLMARRGYARVLAAGDFTSKWQEAVGEPLGRFTRSGQIRRGVLEVTVANSTVMQELTFQKQQILKTLSGLAGCEQIKELRFRIGSV